MDESKKTKKYPQKVRGVATFSEDYGVVFKPFNEGEARKTGEKKARQSSMYTTQGDKKQSKVCHLSVDANSPDPVGDMLEDFTRLTKSDKVEEYTAARGKKLLDDDNVKITANKSKQTITTVITIDVSKTQNFEKQMFDNFQKILQCFTINQTFLVSLRSAQKNSSCSK